ncbi:MAG TPA: SDR family oxidoreductase [Candidatus Gracilibacteria bacterium]|nr:SDR family oxidoreductase [Candidatus Gracilibacteria bacterium]
MLKTILITGAANGLGKTLALKLAQDYRLILWDLDAEKLKRLAADLKADYQVVDLSDLEQISLALNELSQNRIRVEVLINVAGIWCEGPLETNSPLQIQKTLTINTLAPMYLCQSLLPEMKKQQKGQIINVMSIGALQAKSNRSVYYASKWGLNGFTKCLAAELAKSGVTVHGIYPGTMNTGFYQVAGSQKNPQQDLDPSLVADKIVDLVDDPPFFNTEIVMRSLNEY